MDKSRSRRTIKKLLELFRESIILISSIILWVICLFCAGYTLLALFGVDTYYTLLVESILKVNDGAFQSLFLTALLFAILIATYFAIAYKFNNSEGKKEYD